MAVGRYIWRGDSQLQTFKHTAGVTNAKWLPKSHDGQSSCSDDDTVRLWDTRSGECMVFNFAFQSATGGSGIGGLVSASERPHAEILQPLD